jgi:protein MpaA
MLGSALEGGINVGAPRRSVSGIVLCVVAAMWGCAGKAETVVPRPVPPTPPVVEAAGWQSIGTSVEGREIRAWSSGSGERRALVIGAIHGNERSSRDLVDAFIAHVEAHPEAIDGWRVTVIPVANPDGLEKRTRCNANGIDLNRNFPTDNFRPSARRGMKPASEPETRALMRVIETEHPDVIVSVHAPLACVDYDGPAEPLARRMSELCGLPVKKLGAHPGSFGSFAGVDRRIPIITLELPRMNSLAPGIQEGLLDALLAVGEPEISELGK